MLPQVSFAITTAARAASSEGAAGGAVPRKRPRTDNGGAEAEGPSQHASKLFVEKPSPVALGKAIKNKVQAPGTSALHIVKSLKPEPCDQNPEACSQTPEARTNVVCEALASAFQH